MIVDENGMCTLSEEDRSYHSNHKPRPLTNGDRIRAMTDQELAEWIIKHDCHTNLYGYDPKDAILDLLKQEAKE